MLSPFVLNTHQEEKFSEKLWPLTGIEREVRECWDHLYRTILKNQDQELIQLQIYNIQEVQISSLSRYSLLNYIMLDLHPYTLLVTVFVVLVFKTVVGQIGKSTIQEYGWLVYVMVGTKFGLNKSFLKFSSKKHELQALNKQKRSISAQDEYAKWTKLNRKADSLAVELKELEDLIATNKTLVNKAVNMAILVVTTLPIWFFRVWFRKAVLFYLPPGVLPYYVEWCLALPFIQTGGIGLTIWMMSVNSVLGGIAFLIGFVWEKKVEKPELPATPVEEVK